MCIIQNTDIITIFTDFTNCFPKIGGRHYVIHIKHIFNQFNTRFTREIEIKILKILKDLKSN